MSCLVVLSHSVEWGIKKLKNSLPVSVPKFENVTYLPGVPTSQRQHFLVRICIV